MKNFVQPGDVLPVTLAAPVASGGVVIAGTLLGVAAINGATGETIDVALRGVFELPKATGALTQGQAVYWDAAAGRITATSSGNTAAGAAATAAASAAATARVRLKG